MRKVDEHNATLEEANVDGLVLPTTYIHSGQMLELSAENAAISDARFFLDQGLERGTINLAVYLKTVRKLAKFLVKVHLFKINQCEESSSSQNLVM